MTENIINMNNDKNWLIAKSNEEDNGSILVGGLTHCMTNKTGIELLRSVILWMQAKINYQALYTAYLLNSSMSEDEFEKQADKFTVHQKDIPVEQIASGIKRIRSLTWMEFSVSDYASYFQCSEESVQDALRKIPETRF